MDATEILEQLVAPEGFKVELLRGDIPMAQHCVPLTEPTGTGEGADYRVERTTKFGEPAPLDLLGVELDTGDFETLPPITRHRRP